MIRNNLIFKSETKCETSRVKKDGLKTTSNPPRNYQQMIDKHFTTDMLLRIINKLKNMLNNTTYEVILCINKQQTEFIYV